MNVVAAAKNEHRVEKCVPKDFLEGVIGVDQGPSLQTETQQEGSTDT